MEINGVTAHPKGGFLVSFDGAEPVLVSADGETTAHRALGAWFSAGNKATRWVQPIEDAKADALSEARDRARKIRIQIAGIASPERAIAWIIKSIFAAEWADDDTSAAAAVAREGFQIEADITGEDGAYLRDRTLANSRLFFLVTQHVEGMERLAEREIPAATTESELETTINQLKALEAKALEDLAKIVG